MQPRAPMPDSRFMELAGILAKGLVRLGRKGPIGPGRSAKTSEKGLEVLAERALHGPVVSGHESRGKEGP
jgi:hypothetical protein